ncbi:MAG TPA: hypothetical protein DDW85_00585 [Porphyromonadaceae bacterium]|jgi:ferric-dicitrate binding protein FerR (iron transport regulator)|nr:hypothetical protein [Porphyromonadaceae bacterium]
MENDLLIKYCEGLLDTASNKEVETWMDASPENRKTVEDLSMLLFLSDRIKAMEEIDVDEMYDDFARRKSILPVERKAIPLWRKIAGIAAIVIALIVSGTFATFYLLDTYSEPIVVSTRLGEKAQVILPDGSTVWLNACSHLAYKKSFLTFKRQTTLTGEAFFEVTPDRRFPFIVSHDNSEIKVLGTKFNVRCNDDDNFLSASLVEGSILFSDADKKLSVKMKPGEHLLFDKQNNTTALSQVTSVEDIYGWIDGKLIFHNTSLEEIGKDLEKYYNVEIVFNDEQVKRERFTAEFEMTDNIHHILSMLELTNKFTYKTHNREIIISSK